MATRSAAYDSPAYQARMSYNYGQNAAGASTAFGKFVAFTALQIYALNVLSITNGTSTYTAWNGTGTVVSINGDSFSLIRVTNTAAAGSAAALSTTTYGPYAAATGTGTTTGAAGIWNNIPLAQTGIALATATGGFAVNAGDSLHVVRGTDATAVSAFSLEYGLVPGANLTA